MPTFVIKSKFLEKLWVDENGMLLNLHSVTICCSHLLLH